MILPANTSIKATQSSLKTKHWLLATISILVLYFVLNLLAQFLVAFAWLSIESFLQNDQATPLILEGNRMDMNILLSLWLTAIPTLALYIFSRRVHQRTNRSLGLKASHPFRDYGFGLILGSLALGSVLAINLLGQNAVVTANASPFSLGIILLFAIGWMIQGFSEEFICRAVLMNLLAAERSVAFAIVLNSLIFSLLHVFNGGFSFLPALNIFLVGLVFSFLFYLRSNIYMAAAFHSVWNGLQGNVFGLSVSGMPVFEHSLFRTEFGQNVWMHGGDFGLEGGWATTLVLLIVVSWTLYRCHVRGLFTK